MGPKEPIKKEAFSAQSAKGKPKFRGKCFNCDKPGHRAKDYKIPKKSAKSGSKSLSTGPLPTPSGGRGLSPSLTRNTGFMEGAKSAIEQSWAVLEKDSRASISLKGTEGLLWVVDSGASRHMMYFKGVFIKYSVL